MTSSSVKPANLFWLAAALALVAMACQPSPATQPTPAPAQPSTAPAAAVASTTPKPSSPPSPLVAASPSPVVAPSPAAIGPTAVAPSGPLASLAVSYSALIGANLPVWIDSEASIDKQNGLDVNLQYIASSTGLAALVSGQVQIANIGGSEALNAAVGGADLVILGTTLPVYPFVMMAPAGIASVDQLRGKKIGVSQVGSTSDTATRVLLRTAGLDPEKDVTIVAVGSLSNRMAALRDGAIDAGVAQPPEQLTLQKLGFHIVYDLAARKVPAAGGGIVVMRSWLAANHDIAQRYVDSLVQSAVKGRQDKQLAIQVLQKYLQTDDQEALESTYDFFVNSVIPVYPTITLSQYADVVEQLKPTNPRVADFDVSKVLDDSFVQNAMQRKVGGP